MSILYCGLAKTEFNRISSCTTSKQIWTRLEVVHEGTSEVKMHRIRMLQQLFQNFTMDGPNESIDSLLARFADIVNPLKSLGREVHEGDQVTKLLYSLKGATWLSKRIAIEEYNVLEKMSFEGLMGKLKAFEVQLKMMDMEAERDKKLERLEMFESKAIVPKIDRNIAFQTSKEVVIEMEDDESEPEELAMITKNFSKFLKNNYRKHGNAWGNLNKGGGEAYVPRCFKCNEKGHLKADCPQLKAELMQLDRGKRTFNRGMLVTSKNDEDSLALPDGDDDNDVGFKNGMAFMAVGDKVSSSLHPTSDKIVDENMFETIEEAYAWAVESWQAITQKLLKLEARHSVREEERIQLMQELDMANSKNVELLENIDELKKTFGNLDSTTVEKLNIEINDATDIIACLEAEKSKLAKDVSLNFSIISGKNSEIRVLNQSVINYKEKIVSLESDLSKQKGKQIDESVCVASVSPSCDNETAYNARIDELLHENEKLNQVVKSFTSSQRNVDRMLDNLGNHVNRRGLGFGKQPSKPKRTKAKRKPILVNDASHPIDIDLCDYYENGLCYNNVYTKRTCHFCNVKGHLSYDCAARFYPEMFCWVPKVKDTNTSGSITWLPMGASSFVGASSSSSK